MKIKPLHDRVLIKRVEEVTKTAGGIIIPDTAKEKPARKVLSKRSEAFSRRRRKNYSDVR